MYPEQKHFDLKILWIKIQAEHGPRSGDLYKFVFWDSFKAYEIGSRNLVCLIKTIFKICINSLGQKALWIIVERIRSLYSGRGVEAIFRYPDEV